MESEFLTILKSRNKLVLTFLDQDILCRFARTSATFTHFSAAVWGDFYNSHVDRMLNITGDQWHGLCCNTGIHNKPENNRKHMKLHKILLAIVAAAASFGLLSSAQAIPITGMVNIAGQANFNTNSLLTAASATFTNAHVEGPNTGSFAGLTFPTPVVMASYTFDPSTITNGLWSVGGFTFNLLSSTVEPAHRDVSLDQWNGNHNGPARIYPTRARGPSPRKTRVAGLV